MEESQKSCKLAASVDWMDKPVDWIGHVNGIDLAVASGSRLDGETSRLDQTCRKVPHAWSEHVDRLARGAAAHSAQPCGMNSTHNASN